MGRNAQQEADRSAGEFQWPVRVYYEDTDSGGVVYHAAYLRFMERARTEWLRSLGVDQQRLRDEQSLVFVVTAMEIEFLVPARLDDELRVSVRLTEAGKASMRMDQRVVRVTDGVVLCSARVRAACVAADGFRPRRLPSQFLSEFDS